MNTLTRAAKLMKKLGRGPEWKGPNTHTPFRLCAPTWDRKYWHVTRTRWTRCGVVAWFFDHDITDHESACLLQVWLEKELWNYPGLPTRRASMDRDEWLTLLIDTALMEDVK